MQNVNLISGFSELCLTNKFYCFFNPIDSSDKVILDTDLDFELCIKTNFHGELYVVKNPRKEIWSQALSSNFEVSTGFIKKGNSNATLPNSAPQEKQTAVPEWKDLIKALGAINRGMEVAQASCTYKVPLHPLCEAMDIIGFPLRRSNDKGEIHNEARLKILQLIETELESLKNNAKTVEKQVKANDALENVEALKLANTPIVPNGAKIDESTQSTDAATVPKALPEKDVTNSEASRNGLYQFLQFKNIHQIDNFINKYSIFQ